MNTFEVDEKLLARNAATASRYSEQLRAWIDTYDNPAFYEDFARATGFIGAPCGAALREHGQRLRETTEAVAARYDAVAAASAASLAEITAADDAGAADITTTNPS